MNAQTRVVRIRRKGGVVVQDCDVYIGRAMTQGGWALATSEWANPFKIGTMTRDEVIIAYQDMICKKIRDDPSTIDKLHQLRGKMLGCWCAPEPCHGDVLARMAEMSREELIEMSKR